MSILGKSHSAGGALAYIGPVDERDPGAQERLPAREMTGRAACVAALVRSRGWSNSGHFMSFVHPLARAAKVWIASGKDDSEQRVLVVVTTVPLDPAHKGYKKSLIEKLSRAVREHLAESKEAESFVLINRMRDWGLQKS
jgi:hypothetical protein